MFFRNLNGKDLIRGKKCQPMKNRQNHPVLYNKEVRLVSVLGSLKRVSQVTEVSFLFMSCLDHRCHKYHYAKEVTVGGPLIASGGADHPRIPNYVVRGLHLEPAQLLRLGDLSSVNHCNETPIKTLDTEAQQECVLL